jgi:hypothetical protein
MINNETLFYVVGGVMHTGIKAAEKKGLHGGALRMLAWHFWLARRLEIVEGSP